MRGDREVADLAGHLRAGVVADAEVEAVQNIETEALGDVALRVLTEAGHVHDRERFGIGVVGRVDDGVAVVSRRRRRCVAALGPVFFGPLRAEIGCRARLLPGHDRVVPPELPAEEEQDEHAGREQQFAEDADDADAAARSRGARPRARWELGSDSDTSAILVRATSSAV